MTRLDLRHFRTLKAYFLLAMVLIGILPSLLVGFLLIGKGRVALTAQAGQEMSGLVRGFAGEFDSLLMEFQKDSAAIASLPAIEAMDPTQQESLLKELHTHYAGFGQLAVANLDGDLQVVSKEHKLVSIAHIESFQRAANGQQAWVIAPGLFDERLFLHMHTPIRNADDVVIGVLGSPVSLASLAEKLNELVQGIEGNVFLLNETGHLLLPASNAAGITQFDYPQALGFPPGGLPADFGSATFQMNNQRYLAAYAPLPEFNWTIVLERPESSVLAPVTSTINLAILMQIASIFLSLALAVWLARNLTNPVRNLVDAAKALGQGDPDAPLPDSRVASIEIESLTESFREMRRSVIRREESLKRSEEGKRTIINAMPDLLFRINRHGLILDARGQLEESGFAPAEMLIDLSLNTAKKSAFPRPLIAPILLGIEKALQTEQIQIDEVDASTNGRTIVNEVRIVKSGGVEDEALVIIRDITKRIQADADVRRHQSAMAASIDGMAILKECIYIYANQAFAELHGFREPSELIDLSWQELYPSEEQSRFELEILPVLQKERLWRGEVLGQHQNGNTYDQEISLSLLETGEMVSVVRDLTERKKAEEALQKAQKIESIGLLAGGIAHDFNNLLTGMMGQTSIALAKLPEDSDSKKHIERAIMATERAAELTQQLLAYAGKAQFNIQLLNLNALLRENAPLLEALIPRQASLTIDLQPHQPSIKADRTQIQQVAMNLVINAAESLEDRMGSVTVRTYLVHSTTQFLVDDRGRDEQEQEGGAWVCLEVTDTGCGMTDDVMASIFDPFFSTKSQGSGLGLSATLGIIQSHSGQLRVASQEGSGSTFCVYFPAIEHMHRSPLSAPTVAEPSRGTVLVVDDEQIVRETACDVLKSLDLTVLMAENGLAALEIFKQHTAQIAVVLLDMQMPVMDGEETLRHLTALSPNIQVVLTSGYTEAEVATTFVDNRRVFFLQKPYGITTLIEKLNELQSLKKIIVEDIFEPVSTVH